MRVLIVNEFVELGGAEIIAKEQNLLFNSEGIETRNLYFNKGNAKKVDNEKYYFVPVKIKLNKILFNYAIYMKIRKILKNYCPDYIILHGIYSSPISQYLAFKGYKVIQVIHDYGVVCPTSFCVNNSGICEGYKKKKCADICKYHNSKILLEIKTIQLKIIEKLRKNVVMQFVSPSETLNTYLKKYGYNSICINNYLHIPEINIKKIKSNKLRYVYFGGLTEQKGILEFLKSFQQIIKGKDNIQFDLYGGYLDEKYKKQVEKFLSEKIRYHGNIDHDSVIKKIIEADFVIVPSMWMENFSTIILEAMALKTVVIGSDRGGIPEMLNNGRGLIFEYGNYNSIKKVINDSWNISQEKYLLIAQNANVYYQEISNKKKYVKKWMSIMK